MRSLTFFALLILSVVTVSLTVSGDVMIDSPGQDNFSRQFTCLYLDAEGTATERFSGGTYSQQEGRHPKGLSFFGGTRTGYINSGFQYDFKTTTTGPNWIFLYDFTTQQNIDYIQLEVVAHGYQGDCELAAANPPAGWQTSFPPS